MEAFLSRDQPAEHATDPPNPNPAEPPRRPDLSTFFSTLSQITSVTSVARTREHAVPVPNDLATRLVSCAVTARAMIPSS